MERYHLINSLIYNEYAVDEDEFSYSLVVIIARPGSVGISWDQWGLSSWIDVPCWMVGGLWEGGGGPHRGITGRPDSGWPSGAGNHSRRQDEATLCSQTWDTQGIPGGVPGDLRPGGEYWMLLLHAHPLVSGRQDITLFTVGKNLWSNNLKSQFRIPTASTKTENILPC